MVEYGIALCVLCALSFFDKRAMPYAFVLTAGWVFGFLGWHLWPLVSLFSSLTLFWLHLRRPIPVSAAVVTLATLMLLTDVIYLWFRWRNFHFEVEYAAVLNAGLICQILLVGHRGAINAGLRFWSGLSGGVYRSRGRSGA